MVFQPWNSLHFAHWVLRSRAEPFCAALKAGRDIANSCILKHDTNTVFLALQSIQRATNKFPHTCCRTGWTGHGREQMRLRLAEGQAGHTAVSWSSRWIIWWCWRFSKYSAKSMSPALSANIFGVSPCRMTARYLVINEILFWFTYLFRYTDACWNE